MIRRVTFLALPLLGLTAGLVLGLQQAPTDVEAEQLRKESARSAYKSAYRDSFLTSRNEGRKAGRTKGERQGKREGSEAGSSSGTESAEAELAAIAAEEARLAEEAERLANCGHPLFTGCPTDEEIIYEESAETLCGGGNYEEAAAQGIIC